MRVPAGDCTVVDASEVFEPRRVAVIVTVAGSESQKRTSSSRARARRRIVCTLGATVSLAPRPGAGVTV